MRGRRRIREIYIVLVTGDRNYKKAYVRMIKREMRKLVNEHGTTKLLVIEGGAPGVDTLTKKICESMNVHVAEVNALWDTRHASAGPQRNKIMAQLWPDEVIGFHVDISESVGTADMLAKVKKMGIPNRLVST